MPGGAFRWWWTWSDFESQQGRYGFLLLSLRLFAAATCVFPRAAAHRCGNRALCSNIARNIRMLHAKFSHSEQHMKRCSNVSKCSLPNRAVIDLECGKDRISVSYGQLPRNVVAFTMHHP